MERDEKHLKEFLCEAGFFSHAQVAAIENESTVANEGFSQTLIRTGRMQEEDVRRATAKSLSIPYIELEAHEFDESTLAEIPEAFCRTHSVIAYKKEGNTLVVLLLELDAVEALKGLRLLYAIAAHLTSRQTLKRGLLRYQKVLAKRYVDAIAEAGRIIQPPTEYSESALLYGADRLPVKNAMDALLEHALAQGATDIHLEPRVQGLLVRYRIGRQLHNTMQLPAHTAQSLISRAKMLGNIPLQTTTPAEGRFKIIHNSKGEVVIRVHTMPVTGGSAREKAVMHLGMTAHGRTNFALESLGFHGATLESVHEALQKGEGLVVVYGSTSSGKTTLLYTMLDLLIEPTVSIATVEDSVELLLPGVMQAEIVQGDAVTLKGRLRAALSVDPDVLMVATEALEHSSPAIYAANTGKLVLLQVSGNSAEEAISALAQQDAPLGVVAATLQAMVGVKLIRRLCPNHTHSKLTRAELQELEDRGARLPVVLEMLREEGCIDEHAQWKDVQFGRGVVCEQCDDGYKGNVGLQEVTLATRMLRLAIQEDDLDALRAAENRQLTFLEDGIFKAAIGLTSIEEVLRATV